MFRLACRGVVQLLSGNGDADGRGGFDNLDGVGRDADGEAYDRARDESSPQLRAKDFGVMDFGVRAGVCALSLEISKAAVVHVVACRGCSRCGSRSGCDDRLRPGVASASTGDFDGDGDRCGWAAGARG